MGHSLAQVFAQEGCSVWLTDLREEILSNAKKLIASNLRTLIEMKLLKKSRLAQTLKLDGLLVLAEAGGRLAASHPVHLAIIGDGPARDRVAAAAAATNRAAGRAVVRLLGARDDPRPYYLAADIVVGMGSSALRALANLRPRTARVVRGGVVLGLGPVGEGAVQGRQGGEIQHLAEELLAHPAEEALDLALGQSH